MDKNVLTLEQLDSNILGITDININDIELFSYKKDNIFIGYAFIKKEQTNKDNIYIKIFDKYQSNGYGNSLFNEIFQILKKKKFKDITLNIDKSNYRMINILKKNNAIEISNVRGVKEFIIKI